MLKHRRGRRYRESRRRPHQRWTSPSFSDAAGRTNLTLINLFSSFPRKREARACPWLEQGAAAP